MFSWLKQILFPPVCAFCGAKSDDSLTCSACVLPCLSAFDMQFAAKMIPNADGFCAPFFYRDGVKKAILDFKMEGVRRNHIPLARSMCAAMESVSNQRFDFVTCIPSSFSSRMERGFNPSNLLGVYIARHFALPFDEVLRCKKHKKHQKSLGAHERFTNILGKFEVTNEQAVKDKCILLVDDIMTTGATVNEAASMLKRAGAKQVFVVCAAATQKKFESGKIKA